MISNHALMFVLIIAPVVGFLLNGFRFRSGNCLLAGSIATTSVAMSFASALILFAHLLALPPALRDIHVIFFQWINVGLLHLNVSFVVDQISAVMILIITGVGTLIHLFSIGYMSHDQRPTKYFAYLNLFIFNMLVLVLAANLPLMFVGWEGVGLCSYLLIGFWFTDEQKAAAGMKAFVTNRVGDAAFLLGMFILFATFRTLNFAALSSAMTGVPEHGWFGPITLACLLLFVGATGKSAQIPLYVWLPDAMAGPTPVSALIHAATMVTAGVYMIVRLNAVYLMAPHAMMVVACVGAATALVAASIGVCQWDIKKVLAYSTISQLGYMFLAVGVGAFGAGMFHLLTHAFFKGLMFLGSGSVIHAMHDEQDMRKMGGLKKHMPITHLTFCAGWLAIIGMPPFAGFFSKDEILWRAFSSPYGSWVLWLVGLVGAALTAFYMTRLMALTFWGQSRVKKDIHPHEAPYTMTIPLIILGLLSVVGGWIGISHTIGDLIGVPNVLENWFTPVMAHAPLATVIAGSPGMEWLLMAISICVVGLSAVLAFDFYLLHPERPVRLAEKSGIIYRAVANKYWVDEFYFGVVVNPLVELAKDLWMYVDVNVIDRVTYIVSDFVVGVGETLRSFQSGSMQQYALYIALGLIVTISLALVR